jgi:uncharacterized protein (TIGR03437 family)
MLALLANLAGAADVTYTITTVAGNAGYGDGGPPILAQIGAPEGLAFDADGNLYIADGLDHRVRRISPDGAVTTIAGNGRPGLRGDGGPARAAQLNAPFGLAVDAAGNLYIADLGNARIRKVSPGGVISTLATGLTLSQPRNLAVDATGNLYVSDFGEHKVYKITPEGVVSCVAGIGAPGSIKDGAIVEAAQAPLNSPAGLAISPSGALYIADTGNHRIRKVVNGQMTTVPVPPDTLNTPTGIALDAAGDVYVTDKGASAVFKLTPSFTRLAGAGTPGCTGDGGSAVQALLNQPRDVAFDTTGQLYIADACDGGVIRTVAPSGFIATYAGGVPYRPVLDDGPALAAYLKTPSAVAVDISGRLYIADQDDHRVRQVANSVITTVAGTGQAGSDGDGGPATEARINAPDGIAVDAVGDIWIAEAAGNRIRRVAVDGSIDTVLAESLNSPAGIVVDSSGDAYVANSQNHVVRKVTADGSTWIVAGTGQRGTSRDGGAAVASMLDTPTGVCLDKWRNLYVAEGGAIRKVTAAGVLSTAVAAGAGRPARVVVDSGGNIYFADPPNHRVRKVTPLGAVTTIAGAGTPGYSGDGGPATEAQLDDPVDIALDAAGNLFIADRGNGLVRKLTPSAATPPVIEQPSLVITNVVNAASLLAGPIAPGELVTLYGEGFGVRETRVYIDGQPATLLYLGPKQINARVPLEIGDSTSIEIEAWVGQDSVRVLVAAAKASLGIFTSEKAQAAALNEDSSVNSTANPAAPGSVVTLFATGEGQGLPLSARIAEQNAQILSSTSSGGVLRVAVRTPESCPAGEQSVVLGAGESLSQSGVTLAIR